MARADRDPYRRDELDDLIALQLGPVRHTMSAPEPGTLAAAVVGGTPERSLTVHLTDFVYREVPVVRL